MIPNKHLSLSTIFIVLMLAFMTGCIGGTSQKSIYYVFHGTGEQNLNIENIDFPGLGVGPIKIPAYLKRPQIVTRQEANVLTINEFHRWGDSLEVQIASVLVENLSTLLNTPNVSVYQWERHFVPKYQLVIDFRRFEGSVTGSAELEVVWWIVDTKDNKILLTRQTAIEEPVNKAGLKAYVVALNTTLEKLSREIVDGAVKILY